MLKQEKITKRRSVLAFTLSGAVGFGIGGAIGGAIWPSIGQPYFGFVVMGAIGGASLGLALKDWRRALISGLAGAIGFGVGSYLRNLMFALLVGLLAVSLGLVFTDWKRVGLLVLAGLIGFMVTMLNTWSIPPKSFQCDADLLFGGELAAGDSLDIPYELLCFL